MKKIIHDSFPKISTPKLTIEYKTLHTYVSLSFFKIINKIILVQNYLFDANYSVVVLFAFTFAFIYYLQLMNTRFGRRKLNNRLCDIHKDFWFDLKNLYFRELILKNKDIEYFMYFLHITCILRNFSSSVFL